MNETIITFSLIVAILLGFMMMVSVLYVYIKNNMFGIGGAILTPFSVLMVGLSVWKSVEISVSSDGGLEAKFNSIKHQTLLAAKSAEAAAHESATVAKSIFQMSNESDISEYKVSQRSTEYSEWTKHLSKEDIKCIDSKSDAKECVNAITYHNQIKNKAGTQSSGAMYLTEHSPSLLTGILTMNHGDHARPTNIYVEMKKIEQTIFFRARTPAKYKNKPDGEITVVGGHEFQIPLTHIDASTLRGIIKHPTLHFKMAELIIEKL